MLFIDEDMVSITQGDDAVLEIDIHTSAGEDYEMSADEILTLTVRQLPTDGSDVLLSVDSVPGSNRIVLRGEDTKNVAPGWYSYDVQLLTPENRRYTVLPDDIDDKKRGKVKNWKNFCVMPEVTYK